MMRHASTMLASLLYALAMSGNVQAAPPKVDPANEPVITHIEAINVAGREFDADGQTWALSSTVQFHVPGKQRASLRDVSVGERVLLVLEPDSNGKYPVVRSLTVLPN